MIYELKDREREMSLFYHQKWKGCGRRAVLSQRLHDAGQVDGSFLGGLKAAAAIGVMVHAYIETHFRMIDLQAEVLEFTAPGLEQLPTWAMPESVEYQKARDIGLWFARTFPVRLWGQILSIDEALELPGKRETFVPDMPSALVDTLGPHLSPPQLIRHNDLVFRLDEETAVFLTEATGTYWLPGLHVVDWKTTDYAKRGDRYGDGLDSATYRELARVNFARHNEPVFFTYFLIPFGKGAVAKPEAVPVPMGGEDEPGLDRRRVEAMIAEGKAFRNTVLALHPEGLPDVSKCIGTYGDRCPHYLTRCDRKV